MKLSSSANAAVLALVAAYASKGADAANFDFREFEGLWEGLDVLTAVGTGETATYGTGTAPANIHTSFDCKATGDFRKAMCEATSSIQGGSCQLRGNTGPNPRNTLVQKCKFILDQFDGDTGKVDPLMCEVQCCGYDGCDEFPFELIAAAYGSITGAAVPPNAFGPQVNVELTMLAGKNKNSVRAIEVVQQPMISDEAQALAPSGFQPFKYEFQIRKTGGGFKSYD